MFVRLDYRSLGFVLVIVFWVFPGIAGVGEAKDTAAGFIENLAGEAIAALSRKDIPRSRRVKSFHSILDRYFAIETIGRWVVGRYWKRASDEDRAEFMKLFKDFIVETYIDRFSKYRRENISDVLKVVRTVTSKSGDIIVYSRVKGIDGGPPAKVAWRIRTKDGAFRIIDIMVEGISMGLTQRSEFASVIRRNGNGLKGLISALEERLK